MELSFLHYLPTWNQIQTHLLYYSMLSQRLVPWWNRLVSIKSCACSRYGSQWRKKWISGWLHRWQRYTKSSGRETAGTLYTISYSDGPSAATTKTWGRHKEQGAGRCDYRANSAMRKFWSYNAGKAKIATQMANLESFMKRRKRRRLKVWRTSALHSGTGL